MGLLHPPESLDLDPTLRTRVLESCLDRRPPRIPVPEWATPYDAETARLDALLQDIGDAEWHAPVRLRWFEGDEQTSRRTTVAGVIAHLLTVDGLVALTLGLDDPLRRGRHRRGHRPRRPAPRRTGAPRTSRPPVPYGPLARAGPRPGPHGVLRGRRLRPRSPVSYGDFELPLRDSMLDRAFECWVHAGDIAEAVDYPYEPPSPRHLHAHDRPRARMLPGQPWPPAATPASPPRPRPATWSRPATPAAASAWRSRASAAANG